MSAARAGLTIPILAAALFAATLGWFVYDRFRPQPPAERVADQGASTRTADQADVMSRPRRTPDDTEAAVETQPSPIVTRGNSSREATASAPAPLPQPAPAVVAEPAFDIVRVEPTGESVVAGRAAPGSTVELSSNGRTIARSVADAAGQFAFVPPALPAGTHELALQSAQSGTGPSRSSQSVTVVVAGEGREAPLVTVTRPGQPTVVLSRPAEPPPQVIATSPLPGSGGAATSPRDQPAMATPSSAARARSSVSIATVEAEGTGRLYVSGLAAPGSTLRLYLNDAFVAPGSTAPDGRLAFAIERGVKPGEYRVRLDDVDPATGEVRSRAEVPFTVPAPLLVRAEPPLPPPALRPPAAESVAPALPSPSEPAQPRERLAAAVEGPMPALAAPRAAGALLDSTASPGPETKPAASERAGGDGPTEVVVPEVNTAVVVRGDNLWRISKRTYGRGLRYTVIYGANTPQIRNPHRIYPGQIFVLPNEAVEAAAR